MVKGENMVFKLLKSLCGLKHSPRAWNHKIDAYFLFAKFEIITLTTLYISKGLRNSFVIIILYVDIILAFSDFTLLKGTKNNLFKKFEITDPCEIQCFLGIQVNHV
jgi:hypothetical protein